MVVYPDERTYRKAHTSKMPPIIAIIILFLLTLVGLYMILFSMCCGFYLFKYSLAVKTANLEVLKSFLFRVIMISSLFSNAV